VLCPNGWRVPDTADFRALDITLGGTGQNGQGLNNRDRPLLLDKYLNTWGGAFSGYCTVEGILGGQGSYAIYWSQTEYDANNGYNLNFDSAFVIPQNHNSKGYGYTLRCVR